MGHLSPEPDRPRPVESEPRSAPCSPRCPRRCTSTPRTSRGSATWCCSTAGSASVGWPTSGWTRPGRLAVLDVVGESILVTSGLRRPAPRGVQRVPPPRVADRSRPSRAPTHPRATSGALRCPYHSWTYDLDGRLLKAPHTEAVDDFDPAEFGLHEVGVRTWGGFVFVHLTPEQATRLRLGPGRVRRAAGALPAGEPGHRAELQLRRRGQLQGARRELQRVLPLRPGAPRADPARPVVRRGRGGAGVGGRRSRTARAPGRSR